MLCSGDIIEDRYKILKTIGEGAFGTVYLVRDSLLDDEPFALKEMVETDIPEADRNEAVELFAREAEMLKSLHHPGLPRFFDQFSIGSSCYTVMEYVEGETLEDRLERSYLPFSWEEVLLWAEELCRILLYLHSRKPEPVVFRDLKPSNIMIDINGRVKLIDFGIARHYSSNKVKDTYFLGTPGFSPPEQYGRGQSDGRSDIFALGAALYRLLTKADMAQYSVRMPPLSMLSPSVPKWLEKVIMKCLAVNPGERYQSVQALYSDISAREFTSGEIKPLPVIVLMTLPGNMVRMFVKMSLTFKNLHPNIKPVISASLLIFVTTVMVYHVFYMIFGLVNRHNIVLLHAGIYLIISLSLVWLFRKGGLTFLISILLAILILSFITFVMVDTYGYEGIFQIFIAAFILSIFIGVPVCSIYNAIAYKSWKWGLVFFLYCSLLAVLMVPNFLRARSQNSPLSGCKSNLKNIGTAMEMYSSDHKGLYPRNLAEITPHYLKTLPTCPDGRRMSYSYISGNKRDIYTVWCNGNYHIRSSRINMPQYDSLEGLREK